MAIIATGITPNAELGWSAGLTGDRAIAVDALMQTNDPHISAIGECIEYDGQTFGLVDPLWRHAKVLATRLCGDNQKPYPTFENSPTACKLKISGIQLYSAGEIVAQGHAREVIIKDSGANIYRKLIIENDKLVGIVLFGDVRSGAWYFKLMKESVNISEFMPDLIFGEEYFAA
jgi:nitrite reductase (NADH) large subunit